RTAAVFFEMKRCNGAKQHAVLEQRAQLPRHLVAVHPWHRNVRQHRVRRIGFCQLQCDRSRVGCAHFVTVPAQEPRQTIDISRIIVYNQNPHELRLWSRDLWFGFSLLSTDEPEIEAKASNTTCILNPLRTETRAGEL